MTFESTSRHPLLRFVASLDDALDKALAIEPAFMRPAEKRELLVALDREETRLAALRMKVLAVAAEACEDGGHRDVPDLDADLTRHDRSACSRVHALARSLDRDWVHVGAAVATGTVNTDQAPVIVRALDELVTSTKALELDLPKGVVEQAEQHLVDLAAEHGPRALAILGRRILDVVAPEVGEAYEARLLTREEQQARDTMRLTTHRLGGGSTRISIKVPDAVADRFATYLQAYTSPRAGGEPAVSTGESVPYPRKLAGAFCQLLEAMDPTRMPLHGGDATTVMVTIGLDELRAALAGADLGVDGRISAGEVRRLACTASLIPAVLGGRSEILDLGRRQRLFTPAQRRAMALRDRRCRAEGCTIPAAWCEAHHHRAPWSKGGRTDVADGRLLCSWHHHRAHDDRYLHTDLPNGDVRFSRRR